MAQRKRKKRKSADKNNQLFVFLAIIIFIAIISMVVAYFFMDNEPENTTDVPTIENQVTEQSTQDLASVAQIEGTWVGNYDGAMLTISGFSFAIELSGVDAASKMTGTLSVEGNIVTFVFASGNEACKNIEGHYLYSIEDSGELFFKLIKDSCASRRERMSATWFKL